MFTGLIEEVGVVGRVERGSEGARLTIGACKVLESVKLGDSIAVSGACLTVSSVGREEFVADCMPETLSRTTLGTMSNGSEVNLERALALGERLGGHLVLGHVDTVAVVKRVDRRGESLEVRLSLPSEAAAYVAEKGSVALDGVSLTVISVGQSEFAVGLIPHTIGATTLRSLTVGSSVNLEADVIARYVHRSLNASRGVGDAEASESEGLGMDVLIEEGFV